MRHPFEYEGPACSEVGGDYWFPDRDNGITNTDEMKIAKAICDGCIHKIECAEWGIHKEYFGIWGGLTEQQRRIIRRQRNIIVREEGVA